MRKIFLLLACFLTVVSVTQATTVPNVPIIPKPLKTEIRDGRFTLNKTTGITTHEKFAGAAGLFAEMLRPSTGYKLPVKTGSNTKGIVLIYDESVKSLGNEGYILDITPELISIKACHEAGAFYGLQSLRQLLPAQAESPVVCKTADWSVPCLTITDTPRFGWRGYMQDVSRTFYGVDFMKKYIDVMALYKMNVLHWHLTDDQGWRIEIKKYPELTSPLATQFHESQNQPAERSGFYTQEQIRDIVDYAAKRQIRIVPEIDIPGHSWATLLVYPELGVNDNHNPGYVFPFCASWGFWGRQFTPNTLDPTKEEVYQFLDGVFEEVAALFPGDYIHFGGDEVMHSVWEKEPHVQEFMKAKGLKNVNELQSYFVGRVSRIINSKGKKPIGWNDILADADNLPKNTAIMSWLGREAIAEAALNGFYTVATPSDPLYFDITQADRNDGTMSDLAYPNINSLEQVYTYNPTESLNEEEQKYVLGVQANMWPAIPQEVKDVNVQNFPRLLGLAEIGWSEEGNKDFGDFTARIEASYPRLDELKIDYYRKGGYICGQWAPENLKESFSTIEFDVTPKVYADGRIIAGFFYTQGENHMEIRKVELLENGKVISSDEHEGLADAFRGTNKTKTFLYHLKVDNYKKDASYTVRAEARGKNGTDSYGNFTFNLSPYKPFTVTEKQ